MWHVSLSSARLLPVSSWEPARMAGARQAAAALLQGVGEGPDIWTPGERVLHLRRRLTTAEHALLPPGWMAVPAIDRG